MLPSFLDRIHLAGAAGKAGRTALILPSPFLLEQARNELRRVELPAWEFPRILSLDELAASLSGSRKISRIEQEFMVADVVRQTTDASVHRWFDKVLDFAGFITALVRLFDELKMAAATPDELTGTWEAIAEETGRDATRDLAVCSLFKDYQARLEACGATDLAGSYLLAAAALLQGEQSLLPETVFMAEFSLLSPMQLQLIKALKRKATVEIGICFEKGRPEIFSVVEPVYQSLVGMGFQALFHAAAADKIHALTPVRQQLLGDRPEPLQYSGQVELLLAPDRLRETAAAADVAKEFLSAGTYRPAEVAVVVRDPDAYPGLRRVFLERGVPLDLPETALLRELAIIRLVFSWLDLARSRGARAAVLSVLKSPYLAQRFSWQPDELEACLLGAVIRDWADWIPALTRQAPDESTATGWIRDLRELERLAAEWTRPASWAQWAQRLQGLLEWLDAPASLRRCRQSGALDLLRFRAELSALAALLAAARELAECGGLISAAELGVSSGEFAAALDRMLRDRRIPISDREDGGVRVVSPVTASGMQFPVVLVLGLVEGEFPFLPRESWLYGDHDRQLLGEAGIFLNSLATRRAAEDFQFAIAAAMATDRLLLSAAVDGETLPSRYMEEVTRLFGPDAVTIRRIGPQQVVPEKPAEAWGRLELLRGALGGIGVKTAAAGEWRLLWDALVADISPKLLAAAAVEAARQGIYVGEVRSDLVRINSFSASALERFATCPFAFFVSDVLGLAEWAAAEAGLGSLAVGAVWHEVLAVFLARHRGSCLLSTEREAYIGELGKILRESVARRELTGRIVTDAWWKFELPRMEAALAEWLGSEITLQQLEHSLPEYLEWSFGSEPGPGSDPASTARPLILGSTDRPVLLQGKIDRIDRAETAYRIIDYKTGRPPRAKEIEAGLRLQAPLYMLAAESLLGLEVATAEYRPVTRRLSPLVLPGPKGSKRDLLDAAERLAIQHANGIRSGAFRPQPSVCPDHCLARSFCRQRQAEDATATEDAQDE